MLKVKIIISLILYFLLTNHLMAEEPLVKYKTKLKKIENYLNNIQFLSSDFIQTSPEGDINYGKFYLSRPGKMRIEYDKKIPILIIVNNSILSYIDLELEETSNFSTGSTPASFLTRKNISFSAKDIEFLDFNDNGKQYIVSLQKKNRKEAGIFYLIFNKNPISFVKMSVKNDLDQITNITFDDPDYQSKIPSDKFIIKNSNLPQ
jgi:outer membrane lipoprotein-sorting protein